MYLSVLSYSKTIEKPVTFSGIGLHTGEKVNVTIKPANPDTGIIFKRVDLKYNNLYILIFECEQYFFKYNYIK